MYELKHFFVNIRKLYADKSCGFFGKTQKLKKGNTKCIITKREHKN